MRYGILSTHVRLLEAVMPKDVVPNDIKTLIQGTNIKRIYCNGGTSLKLYKKYQEKETGIKAILLPSSSPANARYRLCDLVDIWKKKLTL